MWQKWECCHRCHALPRLRQGLIALLQLMYSCLRLQSGEGSSKFVCRSTLPPFSTIHVAARSTCLKVTATWRVLKPFSSHSLTDALHDPYEWARRRASPAFMAFERHLRMKWCHRPLRHSVQARNKPHRSLSSMRQKGECFRRCRAPRCCLHQPWPANSQIRDDLLWQHCEGRCCHLCPLLPELLLLCGAHWRRSQ